MNVMALLRELLLSREKLAKKSSLLSDNYSRIDDFSFYNNGGIR